MIMNLLRVLNYIFIGLLFITGTLLILYGKGIIYKPKQGTLQLNFELATSLEERTSMLMNYVPALHAELSQQIYQDEDEAIFRNRKRHINNYCQGKGRQATTDPHLVRNLTWFSNQPRFLICVGPKAGSTFWRKTMQVIKVKSPRIFSPYQLSYEDFFEEIARIPFRLIKSQDFSTTLNSTFKFMFTRDPYQKIFSAYVDKVMSPNSLLWSFGKEAVVYFRNSSEASQGADVTFREFIRYINQRDVYQLDSHIRPLSSRCDPCVINYDIIGKMETFQKDTRYILKKLGIFGTEVIFKDMTLEYKVDYVIMSVFRAFELKEFWSSYISIHSGYKRLWRQLQITGVISKDEEYTLAADQSQNLSLRDYMEMALQAFKTSSHLARGNKKEAYLQAYATLSVQDLETFVDKYREDFEMFDYEQRPAELFQRNHLRNTDFDYFDVMKLK